MADNDTVYRVLTPLHVIDFCSRLRLYITRDRHLAWNSFISSYMEHSMNFESTLLRDLGEAIKEIDETETSR